MKNKDLFNSTVDILVTAYKNGDLTHGLCAACAVGNLICANMYDNNKDKWDDNRVVWSKDNFLTGDPPLSWMDVFCSHVIETAGGGSKWSQHFDITNYKGKIKDQIDSTGYTVEELASIEFAFEAVEQTGDVMLKGLYAVYDVLCTIHEVDMQEVATGEEVFVK